MDSTLEMSVRECLLTRTHPGSTLRANTFARLAQGTSCRSRFDAAGKTSPWSVNIKDTPVGR